ncbi:hypothetical protein WJ0W_005663 [Paenibacillus melissococcoides]|uniref:Uncharacterized protein n=1 Tax=Paenibacillus melissococcoides TaxID=2912268 RepID=A0ABN8UB72_9BACL|nr:MULTISPECIES: hypothetical protein [Paenibacillus]MEB9897376.1 hypothetical protein [Bacillus cereus]CAH8248400.1 hypothetical protein WJ0W_005663 [Paenibacillus melissococcoides]CAH8717602.1 hypothetical protein HTL2_004990 [Paenibacillus melissococcoides]CAH8719521.1 hypothetical protein WDD9_005582 [Paenibacillus melissococcoides]GIO77203.1 hypothetical protein J6TS7_08130 [Paenibacillus dendritiformis]
MDYFSSYKQMEQVQRQAAREAEQSRLWRTFAAGRLTGEEVRERALHVLNDLLNSERDDVRLRAAEIILNGCRRPRWFALR